MREINRLSTGRDKRIQKKNRVRVRKSALGGEVFMPQRYRNLSEVSENIRWKGPETLELCKRFNSGARSIKDQRIGDLKCPNPKDMNVFSQSRGSVTKAALESRLAKTDTSDVTRYRIITQILKQRKQVL